MTARKLALIAFCIGLIGVVGIGLTLTGGPKRNQMVRDDLATTSALQQAQTTVEDYARVKEVLPQSWNDLLVFLEESSRLDPPDPAISIDYKPLEGGRYQLCATYKLDSRTRAKHAEAQGIIEDKKWAAVRAGYVCFTRAVVLKPKT